MYLIIILGAAALAFAAAGIRIVRPDERGVVETLGRASGYLKPGVYWRVPAVQRVLRVRYLEHRLRLGPLCVVTAELLSAVADAEITIRLKDDPEAVREAYYNKDSYLDRTVTLAQTALLDLIGGLPARDLIQKRRAAGGSLRRAAQRRAAPLGVDILRADLMEIEFPRDVRTSILDFIGAPLSGAELPEVPET